MAIFNSYFDTTRGYTGPIFGISEAPAASSSFQGPGLRTPWASDLPMAGRKSALKSRVPGTCGVPIRPIWRALLDGLYSNVLRHWLPCIYIYITLQVPFNIVFYPIILVLLPLFGASGPWYLWDSTKNAAKQSLGFRTAPYCGTVPRVLTHICPIKQANCSLPKRSKNCNVVPKRCPLIIKFACNNHKL